MPQVTLRLVTIDNYHEIIPKYITEKQIIISDYDDMTNCVLKMITEGYCFNMDKNLLRGFLEDLTYMFSPNDDKNKDRIVNMLEESDDSDSDSDDSNNDGNMENMMMNMLMQGMKGKESKESQVNEEKDTTEEKDSTAEVTESESDVTEVTEVTESDVTVSDVKDDAEDK